MKVTMDQLIVDPELMKLDTPEKLKELYAMIGAAALHMKKMEPREDPFVFVRVGEVDC